MMNSKIREIYLPFPKRGDRKIWIYIPEHSENEKLPVIYMTDGQNLFDDSQTPHGSWQADRAVEAEMESCAQGAVIVGIDNGNVYRDSELTPKCIGEIQNREELNDIFTPQGEIFDSFLVDTVIPYVEANFPVRTDKSGRAVCGSSSGGLQAFFEGAQHSDLFGCIGAFSPAFLLYTQEAWRNYISEKITYDSPYFYIYTGAGDELEQIIFQSTESVYDILCESAINFERLNEVVLLENEHNEKAWREIFPDFLHTFLTLSSN